MRVAINRLLLLLALICWFSQLPGQHCTDSVFSLRFFTQDSIYAAEHIATHDQGTLIIGETRNYPVKKGLLFRLDSRGEALWSKQIQGEQKLDLSKALALADGSFIVGGVVL